MDGKHTEQLKRMTRRPSSPGKVVAGLLEESGLGVTETAQKLGISRVTLSRLVNEKQELSSDMAQRLGRFFGNGPAIWLRMQQQVELWDLLHADTKSYEDIKPLSESKELVEA